MSIHDNSCLNSKNISCPKITSPCHLKCATVETQAGILARDNLAPQKTWFTKWTDMNEHTNICGISHKETYINTDLTTLNLNRSEVHLHVLDTNLRPLGLSYFEPDPKPEEPKHKTKTSHVTLILSVVGTCGTFIILVIWGWRAIYKKMGIKTEEEDPSRIQLN